MALATAEDVATRLGRSLTAAEEALSEQVIAGVTGLITDAVDEDSAWADGLDPVPSFYHELCVQKTIAIGSNPGQLAAITEQLGQASRSRTFQRSNDVGIFLTDAEERKVRQIHYGTGASSGRTQSLVDDVIDYADDLEINDSLTA